MSKLTYLKFDELSMIKQGEAFYLCEKLEQMILRLDESRSKSLALTKLEETYMWIGKAIKEAQLNREKALNELDEPKFNFED